MHLHRWTIEVVANNDRKRPHDVAPTLMPTVYAYACRWESLTGCDSPKMPPLRHFPDPAPPGDAVRDTDSGLADDLRLFLLPSTNSLPLRTCGLREVYKILSRARYKTLRTLVSCLEREYTAQWRAKNEPRGVVSAELATTVGNGRVRA